jgi:cell division protein FtsB
MYTQKKPIENTHIVREKDRQRNRELLAALFLGVPIGLFLLLFTWQNLEVIRLGREATSLQKTLKDTEAEHKSLEAELDRLTSFETVEKQAGQLGFEATDPKRIVMVEKRPVAHGTDGTYRTNGTHATRPSDPAPMSPMSPIGPISPITGQATPGTGGR